MNNNEIEQHFSGVYEKILDALFSHDEGSSGEEVKSVKQLIFEEFASWREDMKEALEIAIHQQKFALDPGQIEHTLDTIRICRESGMSREKWPQHLLDISNEQMLAVYNFANELWQDSASRDEARKILLLLWNLNPAVGAFWHTYAYAVEKLKDYRTAAFCYLTSLNCNIDYPDPFIPLARCLSKIGRNDLSEELLDHVIALAEKEQVFSPLKEPAIRAKASI